MDMLALFFLFFFGMLSAQSCLLLPRRNWTTAGETKYRQKLVGDEENTKWTSFLQRMFVLATKPQDLDQAVLWRLNQLQLFV